MIIASVAINVINTIIAFPILYKVYSNKSMNFTFKLNSIVFCIKNFIAFIICTTEHFTSFNFTHSTIITNLVIRMFLNKFPLFHTTNIVEPVQIKNYKDLSFALFEA